jgi:hypothetical protein
MEFETRSLSSASLHNFPPSLDPACASLRALMFAGACTCRGARVRVHACVRGRACVGVRGRTGACGRVHARSCACAEAFPPSLCLSLALPAILSIQLPLPSPFPPSLQNGAPHSPSFLPLLLPSLSLSASILLRFTTHLQRIANLSLLLALSLYLSLPFSVPPNFDI